MRFRSSILVAAFAYIAFTGAASAAEVSVSRVSRDALESACREVGGTFWSDLNGYSCIKANCDGKGGNCLVFCSIKGKSCEGRVPKTIKTQSSVRGILNPSVVNAQ
jgi:hypothetical protein